MDTDFDVRARVPADIEAPDRIVANLTARQVAILAVAAAAGWLIVKAAGPLLPLPVLAVLMVPPAAMIAAIVLGRRDGLSLDAWLLAALRYRARPRRLAAAPQQVAAAPPWAPAAAPVPPPVVLRLPAHAIGDDGVIDVGDRATALVATTTVNVALRTGAEQAALVAGYARWLNALTGPVQIVVSARRVELDSHAQRLADTAPGLPHPALSAAASEHAAFLTELAAARDPLWRTVTIACTATGAGAARQARRSAEQTAAALAALGAATRVLDAGTTAAVLSAAVDPYPLGGASWPRSRPQDTITGPALTEPGGAA
ncbi:PrgI family protein [Actinoplanes sp. Pm04-4]|uniref:PrgI family protein n=1 Tax=Paractinoplanes pyxinae TaxID=2997416 RepID=A0ABT4BDF5_9ACTN|nr:PrgI family protein [Actinoplanes pyxinae]MCY1144027.1 PrgI family protein [Actinoplanes pyxinae]